MGRCQQELLLRYPEKLLITQGARGVSIGRKAAVFSRFRPEKSAVADTTGAGDTLNGAFAVEIAAGKDLEEALLFANTAAGLAPKSLVPGRHCLPQSQVEEELRKR